MRHSCFGPITFPDFVMQRCCNPCCRSNSSSGSVGGVQSSGGSGSCTCGQTQNAAGVSGSACRCGCCVSPCGCCCSAGNACGCGTTRS